MGLAASAYLTAAERRPCWVHRSAGAWVHHHGARTIVEDRIVLASPEELDRRAAELFLARYQVQPGEVVMDIGAGVGRETVTFASLVGPTGRVVAVEAHPRTFAMLEATVARNRLANVTAVQAAVGAVDGTVQMAELEEHTHNRVTEGTAGGVSVPARTLASLFDACGVDHVDLLKMNIEGAEGPALVAFADELGPRVRHAVISCHDFVAELTGDDTYRTLETVQACLADAGFATHRRADDPRPYARDTIYADSHRST